MRAMLEMMAGRVHETREGHFVGTIFVSFIGPLFPLRTMYVTSEEVSRHGNATTVRWSGIDLPLHPTSVALGYLRVWLPILAFVAPFALMWGESIDFGRPEWLLSVALLALWIVALVVPGKLRGERAKQIEVLGAATGLALDPAALERVQRAGRADVVGHELTQHGVAIDDPTRLADAARADVLALAYAYARYRAVDDPAWRACASAMWSRIARDGV